MRIPVLLAILGLSLSAAASAVRRCPVDLGPLASARFDLALIDDATTDRVVSSGELVLTKGGAITMTRTDVARSARPIRFFVSGRLDQAQLRQIQPALEGAIAAAPPDPCLIESFVDPGNERSLYGRSELTLYSGTQPTLPTLRMVVVHDDVSSGPTPFCPAEVRALDRALRAIEDALRTGVTPLQCTPYGSRPN